MNAGCSGDPSSPRTDKEREKRKRDGGKADGKDRDLEHGEGGTLGLDKPEDLRRDD